MSDGGGGWFEPPLVRPVIGGRVVYAHNLSSHGGSQWRCAARWGWVGPEITTAELLVDDTVDSRPIESPVGAVVVAFDALRPSTIRLMASDGAVVESIPYDPESLFG